MSTSNRTSMSAVLLEALLESARLLHSSLDLDHLLRHLLRTVMGRRLISKGLVAVREEDRLMVALARGTRQLKPGAEFDPDLALQDGLVDVHPIDDGRSQVGLMALGKGFRPTDESEGEFLAALLALAGSGISNARAHAETRRLNLDLEKRIHDLRTLLEMVQTLTSTLNPADVARTLTFTLAGRWAVGRYAVAAWKEGHDSIQRCRGLDLPELSVIQQALREIPEASLVADLPPSPLKDVLLKKKGQVVFPLRSAEEDFGIIALGTRPGTRVFEPSDLEFGSGLVAQAVVAFKNGWYFHETLEKRRMEQEIGVAASIQQDLFPSEMPELSGFSSAARSLAARQVGGDYYDALPLEEAGPDAPYLVCVVDVSGKGIPASLLMSNIQATLRALLSSHDQLVDLVTRTSALLYATTPSNKYATAILIRLEPETGRVRYVNAGHNDGLLLRADGSVEHFKSTGPPLGLIPNLPFTQEDVEMRSGDLLALYSDGVVEAQNAQEEELEEEPFLKCLQAHRDRPAAEIITEVYRLIEDFAGETPQHDDITLMLIKRN